MLEGVAVQHPQLVVLDGDVAHFGPGHGGKVNLACNGKLDVGLEAAMEEKGEVCRVGVRQVNNLSEETRCV